MPHLIKIVSGLFVTCFMLFACGEYPCRKASSPIGLVSFTDIESDPIILKRFAKGTNYVTLQNTFIISKTNSNFQRQNDTLLILHSINGYHDITSDYDYEIYLPKVSRLYKLSEVIEDIQFGRRGGTKEYCINPIVSYKVDGQFISSTNNYGPIYLTK